MREPMRGMSAILSSLVLQKSNDSFVNVVWSHHCCNVIGVRHDLAF
jgi:hypothetical protein